MALGLESSEDVDNYWSQNLRRKIFYFFPNGTAPLTGLLSLMNSEETAHPEFGWWEDRFQQVTTLTASNTSNVAFYLGGTTTTAGTTFTPTIDTAYRLYVTTGTGTNFQVDDMIKVLGLTYNTGGVLDEISARVTATSANYLEIVQTSQTLTGGTSGLIVNNAASVIGLNVLYAGSAFAEGSRSRTGSITFPINIKNYTQICKRAFEMTRTAMKEPTTYSKTGDYRNQMKKNGLAYLQGMEYSFIWGDRKQTTAVDPDTGSTVRRGMMGGIIYFLKQWERGNVSNGGDFDYRVGGTDVSNQTDWQTYTDKRIIRLAGATLTKSQWDILLTRAFERQVSPSWEKLILCGPDFMAKVASAYERQIQWTSLRENGFKGFDFVLAKVQVNAGTVYFKVHPLMNQINRSDALILDLGSLRHRYLSDSDTMLQTMIQLPDADKRKDQWLSESSLEVDGVESNMFIQNFGGIVPG